MIFNIFENQDFAVQNICIEETPREYKLINHYYYYYYYYYYCHYYYRLGNNT